MKIPKTSLELKGIVKKNKERSARLRNITIGNTIDVVKSNTSDNILAENGGNTLSTKQNITFDQCDDFHQSIDPNSKTKILEKET